MLKYICTGATPPGSDKGKKFILEPNLLNQNSIDAEVRLKFMMAGDRQMIAKRKVSLKMLPKGSKLTSI